MKLFDKKLSDNKKRLVLTIFGIKLKLNVLSGFYNKISGKAIKIYKPFNIINTAIGDGTYIAKNSDISMATIGKYCSIGPNFTCGYGIHPTNGISTNPCFYSTYKQNGMSFCTKNKITERKEINIGNDVFIGMNVTILDGVTIGDGAVIAAGAVVVKDVEPYSIVGGVPAKHIKYRFSKDTIKKLLAIQWWNWDREKLKSVEKMFFDVENFANRYYEQCNKN